MVGSSQFNKGIKNFYGIRRGKKRKKNMNIENSRESINYYTLKCNSARLVDIKSVNRNHLHFYITAISRNLIFKKI